MTTLQNALYDVQVAVAHTLAAGLGHTEHTNTCACAAEGELGYQVMADILRLVAVTQIDTARRLAAGCAPAPLPVARGAARVVGQITDILVASTS